MAQKPYQYGLVIGKFDPYHKGHRYLIETAAASCRDLKVLIVDSKDDLFPATKRMNWILGDCNDLPIVVGLIDDIYDDDNSQAWADHTRAYYLGHVWPSRWTEEPWTGCAPQVVFTSEDYGPDYAGHLGIGHVMVDRERTHIPISATDIRSGPRKYWSYVPDSVRPDLVTKIVVMGPESSGTTTLATSLAYNMQSPLVAEYGRFFCESMQVSDMYSGYWHGGNFPWTKEDFEHIAAAQTHLEGIAIKKSNGLIVCDTDAIATRVFYQSYCETDDEISTMPRKMADLYIITNPKCVPFHQDGTRNEKINRDEMYQKFINECVKFDLPVLCVNGSADEMFATALIRVKKVFDGKTLQRGGQ